MGSDTRNRLQPERIRLEAGVAGAEASAVGALEHQLQLTHGGAADVERSPAGGQKDRGQHEQEPSVHGMEMSVAGSYGGTDGYGRASWRLIEIAAFKEAPDPFT